MVIDPKTLSSREVYNLLVSAVAPRPIAFITSMNVDDNGNPFFNAISSSPSPCSREFRQGTKKRSDRNI